VIRIEPDGRTILSYRDWTANMMALSTAIYELPARRPGVEGGGRSTHLLGIDRLARMRDGDWAIILLYDHIKELEYRPDEAEVLLLGKTLLMLDREVAELCRSSRSKPRFVRSKRFVRRTP